MRSSTSPSVACASCAWLLTGRMRVPRPEGARSELVTQGNYRPVAACSTGTLTVAIFVALPERTE